MIERLSSRDTKNSNAVRHKINELVDELEEIKKQIKNMEMI